MKFNKKMPKMKKTNFDKLFDLKKSKKQDIMQMVKPKTNSVFGKPKLRINTKTKITTKPTFKGLDSMPRIKPMSVNTIKPKGMNMSFNTKMPKYSMKTPKRDMISRNQAQQYWDDYTPEEKELLDQGGVELYYDRETKQFYEPQDASRILSERRGMKPVQEQYKKEDVFDRKDKQMATTQNQMQDAEFEDVTEEKSKKTWRDRIRSSAEDLGFVKSEQKRQKDKEFQEELEKLRREATLETAKEVQKRRLSEQLRRDFQDRRPDGGVVGGLKTGLSQVAGFVKPTTISQLGAYRPKEAFEKKVVQSVGRPQDREALRQQELQQRLKERKLERDLQDQRGTQPQYAQPGQVQPQPSIIGDIPKDGRPATITDDKGRTLVWSEKSKRYVRNIRDPYRTQSDEDDSELQ